MKKILLLISWVALTIILATFSYAYLLSGNNTAEYDNMQKVTIPEGKSIVFSLSKHIESIDFNKDSGFTIRTLEWSKWIDMSNDVADYIPMKWYIIRNASTWDLTIDIIFKDITDVNDTFFGKTLKAGWNLVWPASKDDDQKMVTPLDAFWKSDISHVIDYTWNGFIDGDEFTWRSWKYLWEARIEILGDSLDVKNSEELINLKVIEGFAYAVFVSNDTTIPWTQGLSSFENAKNSTCTSNTQDQEMCEITEIENLYYTSLEAANILAANAIIVDHSSNPSAYQLTWNVTKKEMVKFIMKISWRAIPSSCSNSPFDDIASSDWVCKYVQDAVNAWYINAGGNFLPDSNTDKITALKLIMKARWIDKTQWISSEDEAYVDAATKLWITDYFSDYNSIIDRWTMFIWAAEAIEPSWEDDDLLDCLLGCNNSISLNPETPANSIIQGSNEEVPLLVFDVEAGSEDLTLSNVVLEFIWLGDLNNLDDISVYNDDGAIISKTKSFSEVSSNIYFNDNVTVVANSSMKLTIKGRIIPSSDETDTYGIKLVKMEASSYIEGESLVGWLMKVINQEPTSITITQTQVNERELVLGNGVQTVLYKWKISVWETGSVNIKQFELVPSSENNLSWENLDDVIESASLNIGGFTIDGNIESWVIEFKGFNKSISAGSDNVEILIIGTLKSNDNITGTQNVLALEVDISSLKLEDNNYNNLEQDNIITNNTNIASKIAKTNLLDRWTLSIGVVKDGQLSHEIESIVLAGTSSVGIAEVVFQAEYESIEVDELIFTTPWDFSDTLLNVNLIDSYWSIIASDAVINFVNGDTQIAFRDFIIEESYDELNAKIVADIRAYDTTGDEIQSQLGDIIIDVMTPLSISLEGKVSNNPITDITKISWNPETISIVPALVVTSINQMLWTDNKYATIEFTIDKGGNNFDNDNIAITSVEIETAVNPTWVSVRNSDSTTIATAQTTTIIAITNENGDAEITTGDTFEFKVVDNNSELKIVPNWITYTLDGSEYTTVNTNELNLWTYTTDTVNSWITTNSGAIVILSIADTLWYEDKYATINFHIDNPNNDEILITKIDLETAIGWTGLVVSNDDNTIIALNDTTSEILINDSTSTDYIINNGDSFQFKVSNNDGNSHLKIKPHGISYSIDGETFTSNNTETLDLWTYTEEITYPTGGSIMVNPVQVNDRELVLGNWAQTVLNKVQLTATGSSIILDEYVLIPSHLHSLNNGLQLNDIIETATMEIDWDEYSWVIEWTSIVFTIDQEFIEWKTYNLLVTSTLQSNDNISNGDILSLRNETLFMQDHWNDSDYIKTELYKSWEVSINISSQFGEENQNVLAWSNDVELATIEIKTELEDAIFETLTFRAWTEDFSDTLMNVRLMNWEFPVATWALINYDKYTLIEFWNFQISSQDDMSNLTLIANLRSYNSTSGETTAQLWSFHIDYDSSSIKWESSNKSIEATHSNSISNTINIIPALVSTSIVKTLWIDNKYATLEFTIDKGNNDFDTSDIVITTVEIETAVTPTWVTVRNSDNTTIATDQTTTTIAITNTNGDAEITTGDIFEFGVEDNDSELRIVPKGITYTVAWYIYTTTNSSMIDLWTYSESN